MRLPVPCPNVTVRYFDGAKRSLMVTNGISIGDSTFLTLGIASQGKFFDDDAFATVSVSRFGQRNTDTLSGPISLALDDDVSLTLPVQYSTDANDGLRFEMISATVPLAVLRRISASKAVSGTVAARPFALTVPQLGAFANFSNRLSIPVTDEVVSENCPQSAPIRTVLRSPLPDATPSDEIYRDDQVTKPAALVTRSIYPEYPEALRKSGFDGKVTVQFVVREDGTAAMTTFKVLQSTDYQFSEAVRNFVPRLRFSAAELNGKRVKQVVQLPFEFRLNH